MIRGNVISPRPMSRRKSVLRAVAVYALLSLSFLSVARADLIAAVNFSTPSENFQNDYPWTLGFDFLVYEDFSIHSLGFYDAGLDGFAEDHAVGIWDEQGTLLAHTVITNASTLGGPFRWEAIDPITLIADNYYIIAGFTSQDDYTWNPEGYSLDGRLNFRGARYEYSDSLDFPTESLPELIGIFGPNFLIADPVGFEPPTGIPLPSSMALLLVGFALLISVRHRYRTSSKSFAFLLPGLILVCASNQSYALSATAQPVQGPAGWEGQVPLGTRYLRYTHDNVGAIINYDNVYDLQGNYIVPVGDKFRWVWVRDGIQLSAFEMTYIGGPEKCWVTSTGNHNCGPYDRFLAYSKFKCRPETGSYKQIVFWNGNEISSHEFDTERFKMERDTASWQYPTELKPMPIKKAKRGQKGLYAIRVLDDLGCNVGLNDVEVTIQSFLVPNTNDHSHFSSERRGTGEFNEESGFPITKSIQGTKAQGKTNQSGQFKVSYTAMDYALSETIRIKLLRPAKNGHSEDKLDGSVALTIRAGNFIQGSVFPHSWEDSNFTDSCTHDRQARSLRSDVHAALVGGLTSFNLQTQQLLRLNDASFPWGGATDTLDADCNSHDTHRLGIDIDVEREMISGKDLRKHRHVFFEIFDADNNRFTIEKSYLKVLNESMNRNGFKRDCKSAGIHYRHIGGTQGADEC